MSSNPTKGNGAGLAAAILGGLAAAGGIAAAVASSKKKPSVRGPMAGRFGRPPRPRKPLKGCGCGR